MKECSLIMNIEPAMKATQQSDVAFIMAFLSKALSDQALTTATALYLPPVNEVAGR